MEIDVSRDMSPAPAPDTPTTMMRFGLRARLILGLGLIGLIMAGLTVGLVFSRLAGVEEHAV